jgi:hypothetical protein
MIINSILSFEFPPINELLRWRDVVPGLNKVGLIAIASALIGTLLFLSAARKDPKVAPKGTRNLAEVIVEFIENNIIRDSNRGISLGGTLYPVWNRDPRPDTPPLSHGVVVKDNKFMNVEREIVDNKSEATRLINNSAIDDRTPPVTTANVGGRKTGGVHAGDVTVRITATDDAAGVKRTEYSLDGGGSWRKYEVPVVLADEGVHVIHYRSLDRVENMEQAKSLEVTIAKGSEPSPAPSKAPAAE